MNIKYVLLISVLIVFILFNSSSYIEKLFSTQKKELVVNNLSNKTFSLKLRDAEMKIILNMMAQEFDFELIMPEDISGKVTVDFEGVTLEEALDSLLAVQNLIYAQENNKIQIYHKVKKVIPAPSYPVKSPWKILETKERRLNKHKSNIDYGFIDHPKEDVYIRLIKVEPDETLGHYSSWSNFSKKKLRKLNFAPQFKTIQIGQIFKIPIGKTTTKQFEAERRSYHEKKEKVFLSRFNIKEIFKYTIKKSDSVWMLCNKYNIPYWLLRKFNIDLNFSNLKIGTELSLPVLAKKKL